MAMVTITKGGITTEVPKGELDWYKRNGWTVAGEVPGAPEAPTEPEAPTVVEDAETKPKSKKK